MRRPSVTLRVHQILFFVEFPLVHHVSMWSIRKYSEGVALRHPENRHVSEGQPSMVDDVSTKDWA